MSSNDPAFTFVDLFAGIGGFHAALSAVRVTGSDPYGLDADNDGYGCD